MQDNTAAKPEAMLQEHCKRLEPLIEAVFAWPSAGDAPLPVQQSIQQYFKQVAAAATAGGEAGPQLTGPPIHTVQQLQSKLVKLIEPWREVRDTEGLCAAYDAASSTVNMIVDAVSSTASELALQQQEGSFAVRYLVEEGYRAGCLLQGVVAMERALYLPDLTHKQLSQLLDIGRVLEREHDKHGLSVLHLFRQSAWDVINGDSRSKLECPWKLQQATLVLRTCFQTSVMDSCIVELTPESNDWPPPVSLIKKYLERNSNSATGSSGSSVAQPALPSSSCTTGGQESATPSNAATSQSNVLADPDLPLDDCPWLRHSFQGLTPVLAATGRLARSSSVNVPAREFCASLAMYATAYVKRQLPAAFAVPEGTSRRRRTLIPNLPLNDYAEDGLAITMAEFWEHFHCAPFIQVIVQLATRTLDQLLHHQRVRDKPEARQALHHACVLGANAAIACIQLQLDLGITIITEQHLLAAVRSATDMLHQCSKYDIDWENDEAAITNLYTQVASIQSNAAGSSSSSSSSTGVHVRKSMPCDSFTALSVLSSFPTSVSSLITCDGPLVPAADAVHVRQNDAGQVGVEPDHVSTSIGAEAAGSQASRKQSSSVQSENATVPSQPKTVVPEGAAVDGKPASAAKATDGSSQACKHWTSAVSVDTPLGAVQESLEARKCLSELESSVSSSSVQEAQQSSQGKQVGQSEAAKTSPAASTGETLGTCTAASTTLDTAPADVDTSGGDAADPLPEASQGGAAMGSSSSSSSGQSHGRGAEPNQANAKGDSTTGGALASNRGPSEQYLAQSSAAVVADSDGHSLTAGCVKNPSSSGAQSSSSNPGCLMQEQSSSLATCSSLNATKPVNTSSQAAEKDHGCSPAAAAAAAAASTPSPVIDQDLKHCNSIPHEQDRLRLVKRLYCSPMALKNETSRLSPIALQVLTKHNLHIECGEHGWNALHFACASRNEVVVRQLLEAGADPNVPGALYHLRPLHLACMGKMTSESALTSLRSVNNLEQLVAYVDLSGCASLPLVRLLLQYGADCNATCHIQSDGVLEEMGVLHLLTCWACGNVGLDCMGNPFLGKGVLGHKGLNPHMDFYDYACDDLDQAELGCLSLSGHTKLDELLKRIKTDTALYDSLPQGIDDWYEGIGDAVLHLFAAKALIEAGADLDAEHNFLYGTPLMMAAYHGNAAMISMLMRAGADPERQRYTDGVRALDIAAGERQAVAGWTLLCEGAQANPAWRMGGAARYRQEAGAPHCSCPANHRKLLSNAMQCDYDRWRLRFVERILHEWPYLDEFVPETGVTALLAAIHVSDVDMVELLVRAGADVNKPPQHGVGDCPIAAAVEQYTNCPDMLPLLLSAGADFQVESYSVPGYDMVQLAANCKELEAVLKLVEAGAQWKVPPTQRVTGGTCFYPPEIVCINIPTLKLGYVEGRFKLAEKLGKQKRAAISAALEPWFSPQVVVECREATLRALYASRLTPCKPGQHQQAMAVIPLGRKSAWKQLTGAAEPKPVAVSEPDAQTPAQPAPRLAAAVDDLDALVAAIEAEGDSEAASSKAAPKKKKKKETAAQKEAKKKQQQKAQQLLHHQQQPSDSEGEGDQQQHSDSSSERQAQTLVSSPPAQLSSSDISPDSTLPLMPAQQDKESQPPGSRAAAAAAAAAQPCMTASSVQHAQQPPQLADPQKKTQANRQQPVTKLSKGLAQQQQDAAGGSHAVMQPQAAGGQGSAVSSEAASSRKQAAAAPEMISQQSAAARQGQGAQLTEEAHATWLGVHDPAQTVPAAVPPPPPQQPPLPSPSPLPAAAAAHTPSSKVFLPPHLRINMAVTPAASTAPATAAAGSSSVAQTHAASQHHCQVQQQQQQQQQQHSKDLVTPLPEPPSAMPALLPATGRAPSPMTPPLDTASPGALHQPNPPAASAAGAGRHSPLPVHSGTHHQVQHSPAAPPAATHKVKQGHPSNAAPVGDAGKAVKARPKLCIVCQHSQRNVLLMPCNHMVLCSACAEQLASQGNLSSCPHCKRPSTQRIRVHQS